MFLNKKDHSLKSIFRVFWVNRIPLGVALIPCFILAQFYLFAWNHFQWDGISGPPAFVHNVTNHDGIWGATSNAIRYLLESFHFPAPIDTYICKIFGVSMSEKIQSLHDQCLIPLISNFGLSSNYEFQIQWEQTEHSWFGPFGFIFLACLPLFIFRVIQLPNLLL